MFDFYLKLGDYDAAVFALKGLLNATGILAARLDDLPRFDLATRAAVMQFQTSAGIGADGVMGPKTWALLGRRLRYAPFVMPPLTDLPPWARNLLLNDPVVTTLEWLDIDASLALYEKIFHHKLSASERAGLAFLLGKLVADRDVTDVRWAAYMLATVKHESAHTWQPVDEKGGTTHWYGKEVEVKDAVGNKYKNRYYGRGYVQLTLQKNYIAMGTAMGLGDQLFLYPERVKDPELAYRIMSYGMRNGSFNDTNHQGLRHYINGSHCDYYNARELINTAHDCADMIAGHAENLELVLLGGITNVQGILLGGGAGVCR
jgi:hypothetical protein